MKVSYGRLGVDVPDRWEDRTALSFYAPSEPGLVAPLSVKQPDRFRRALQVSAEARSGSHEQPKDLLAEADRILSQNGLSPETLEERAFLLGGHPGWLVVRRLHIAETLVRQYVACAFTTDFVLHANVSVAESGHEQHRAETYSLLAAITFNV